MRKIAIYNPEDRRRGGVEEKDSFLLSSQQQTKKKVKFTPRGRCRVCCSVESSVETQGVCTTDAMNSLLIFLDSLVCSCG